VKFLYVPADVVLGWMAKERQLGLVGIKNDAVRIDEMQRHRAIVDEIHEVDRLETFGRAVPGRS